MQKNLIVFIDNIDKLLYSENIQKLLDVDKMTNYCLEWENSFINIDDVAQLVLDRNYNKEELLRDINLLLSNNNIIEPLFACFIAYGKTFQDAENLDGRKDLMLEPDLVYESDYSDFTTLSDEELSEIIDSTIKYVKNAMQKK